MNTQEAVVAMLTENTGRHVLDSGGAYGRNWERNQFVDFDGRAEAIVRFDMYNDGELGVEYTKDLYHFLVQNLDYEEDMTKLMLRYADLYCEHDSWFESAEKFMISWCKHKSQPFGVYGEDNELSWTNTYNGEDALSQTIQFAYFGEGYIMLMIHGGCDVRGGYTMPRIFTERGYSDAVMYSNARGGLYCDNDDCDAGWYTDDNWHWYANNYEQDLKKYPAEKVLDEDDEEYLEQENRREEKILEQRSCGFEVNIFTGEQTAIFETLRSELRGIKGTVLVTEDHEAYCPVCGIGKLKASMY